MTQPGGDEPSYSSLLGRLLKDGERFAKTRIQLYRALAYYRFSQARGPALMLLGGVLLAAAALVALLVGLVLALALVIGPLWAGLVIGFAGLAAAAAMVIGGVRAMPDLTELPFEKGDIINYEADTPPDTDGSGDGA